jgi:hypothetical protein
MATLRKLRSISNGSLLGYDGTAFPSYEAVRACLSAPVLEYNGARKIVQSVGFSLPKIPEVDLEAVGYNPKVKMKNLERMYYNPEEATRVRALLTRRADQAFSALAYSFRAGAKDSRSMGHCMESMVIGLTKKTTTVEVLYRSTEVIKKHSADLAFLPVVFDRLEVKPDIVKFYFTHAYLSGVFFPTLFRWWDPIVFLEKIRIEEPKLFVVATRFLRRSVRKQEHEFPYAPEKQQHIYAWKHYPERMPEINEYLEQYL